jgi:hypothetical protein
MDILMESLNEVKKGCSAYHTKIGAVCKIDMVCCCRID